MNALALAPRHVCSRPALLRCSGAVSFVLVALAAASAASAASDYVLNDFTLALGYANISLDSPDSVLQDEGALRWDGQFATSPLAALPQLRLGAALGLSMVLDDEKFIIHSSGGATFIGSADMPLYMLEPEIRLSWRQHLDAGKVWYIEPGIGAGGAFANLSLDGEDTSTGESFDEWDDTWTTRVYLNVGARVVGGLAGVQASYMRGGEIDFAEEASGDLEQWFIGIFGALQF